MKTIEKIESMNSIKSTNFHKKQKQYVFDIFDVQKINRIDRFVNKSKILSIKIDFVEQKKIDKIFFVFRRYVVFLFFDNKR